LIFKEVSMPGRQGKVVFFEDKAGEYRWHLKAPNGEIIADSGEGYSSFFSCTSGFESLQKYSQNPETENQVEGKRYTANISVEKGLTPSDLVNRCFKHICKKKEVFISAAAIVFVALLLFSLGVYLIAEPGERVSILGCEFLKRKKIVTPDLSLNSTPTPAFAIEKPTVLKKGKESPISEEKSSDLSVCRSLLRDGIDAGENDIITACKLVRNGWEYIMPEPKSAKAAWGIIDRRTTWFYGYWENNRTERVSIRQPKEEDNLLGDGALVEGSGIENGRPWRGGGAPTRNPTIIEWLCSKQGGPPG
jgi:uncharacterized protein YegP (UPF0339 family)